MTPHAITQISNWFVVADILVVAAFFHVLPGLTRRDIFFAVTVDPAYRRTDEARRLVRRFRAEVWVHSLIACALAFAGIATNHMAVFLAGIGWQGAGSFLAFRRARQQVKQHGAAPSPRREAVFVPRAAEVHGHRLLQLGPFAILFAAALDLRANWARIPQRFPVHWGVTGQPNGWATRSLAGVFGPLVMGFTMCVGFALFAYATVHWTRQVRASGPDADREHRFRRTQLVCLFAVEYFLSLLFAWISLLPLRARPGQMPGGVWLIPLASLALVVSLYAVLIRAGQGGENLLAAGQSSDIAPPAGFPMGDRTPDSCWKAGMFYVNPDDPALLVEKRFGIGYTLNFGRPAACLLFMAMIAAFSIVPVALALLSTHAR